MAGIRRKNIELVAAGKRIPGRAGKRIWRMAGAAAVPVAVLCCFLAMVYGCHRKTEEYIAKTAEIDHYLQSELVVKKREELERLDELAGMLSEYRASIENADKSMASLRPVDIGTVELLLENREGKIEIRNLSFEKGMLSFTGIAQDYREVSLFIRRLAEDEVSSRINYTGFSVNDDGKYEFHVTFMLGE